MDAAEYEAIIQYKVAGNYPPHFNKKNKEVLRRKAARYEAEGEELFYWINKVSPDAHKTKVIQGAEEARTIFTDFHTKPTEGHCGRKNTREAISKHFYWPEMSADINLWVSQCSTCQAASSQQPAEQPALEVSNPFELVGVDLIENLPQTAAGHQYICLIMDYFTKWPEAYPLKTTSAQDVTECIVKFFYQFGAPKKMVIGQKWQIVDEVLQMLNIETSPFTPDLQQLKGLVCNMKGTIQRALSKTVGSQPETWEEHLGAVMFGLRTKKQKISKFSPFYLMFGREASLPSDIPEDYPIDDDTVEQLLAMDEDLIVLQQQDVFAAMREKVAEQKQKKKNKR